MPRKTFNAGDVLTAADVNDFLMNQSVMTFADSTARGSAIGTAIAQEGMLTYLEDTDTFEYWDGSAFTAFGGGGGAATNAIINGAFDIWQRGTSFGPTSTSQYTADRFQSNASGGTVTTTRQTFTPADIQAVGFGDAQFFFRIACTVADDNWGIIQPIEDVRTLANQQVTLSFWAKADATRTARPRLSQNFGSGGSSTVFTDTSDLTLTTSWTRFSVSATLPSISGKTIGASNFLGVQILNPNNETGTFDFWGLQLEAGPVATPFKRNANSLQGELAACQRYYYRAKALEGFSVFGFGAGQNSTTVKALINFPVTMRVAPTAVDFSTLALWDTVTVLTITSAALSESRSDATNLTLAVASGITIYRPYFFIANNSTSAFVGFSAEL